MAQSQEAGIEQVCVTLPLRARHRTDQVEWVGPAGSLGVAFTRVVALSADARRLPVPSLKSTA